MNKQSMHTRLLVLIALVVGTLAAFGQQHPNIKKGFNVDNAYQIGELDHVNAFNGNLVVQIPIGPQFQVGGSLSYSFAATYNSKVWEFENAGALASDKRPIMKVIPTRRSNAGFGWLFSLGRILDADNPFNKTGGIVYESPDGAEHAIWCTLHEDEKEPWFCDGVTTRYANDANQTQGYTRDGTYIRMRWRSEQIAMIEFPDGTRHLFEDDPVPGHRALRIVGMEDRFGNTVKIEYPNAQTCSEGGNSDLCWKITDSSSTGNDSRVHWVRFERVTNASPENYRERVKYIDVAQWGTSDTARYEFIYEDKKTNRTCVPANFAKENVSEPTLPWLKTIKLPTGDTYQFDYNPSHQRCGEGAMNKMVLPTKAETTYDYQIYKMPSMHCNIQAVLNETAGILKRTVKDTARGGLTYTWDYTTQLPLSERLCDADVGAGRPFPIDVSPELKNTVKMPTGEKVIHYFSVWPKQADSTKGFKRHEYGLPFTRNEPVTTPKPEEQTLYLSTQTTDVNSDTVMSATYISYDMDPKKKFQGYEPTTWDRNRRVLNSLTFHPRDDKHSQTLQDVTQFDGLGHYRASDTDGSFPGSNDKTTFVNYNPGRKMPKTDGVPTPVNPTIGHNEQWLLETYDKKTVTEAGKTLTTLFCFDNTGTSPTGFLRAKRTLAATKEVAPNENAQQSNTDLLVLFEHEKGNVTREKYYGGDGENATAGSNCTPTANKSPQYELAHTYAHGVLATSTHVGSGFLSVDNDIDQYTGLVSESRDSAGIFTKFAYDSLGRLTSVTPQSGHGATFSYLYAIRESSPTVDITATGGAGQVNRKFVRFDSLGRLWRTFDQLPGTTNPTSETWSFRQVDYDGLNRQTRIYQPVALIAEDPGTVTIPTLTDFTAYTYDYFGRPKEITPPDQVEDNDPQTTNVNHKIKYDYHNGVRQVTETVRRIEPDGVKLRETSVVRIYDRYGRLHQVKENASNTSISPLKGGEATTTYTYDAADRLVKVQQGSQNRTFTYDGRGFLLNEFHPESGDSLYGGYDARGHAKTRNNGGNTLTFDYDKAERLETITDQHGTVLKKFVYGDQDDGNAQGKLLTARRTNDVLNVGRVDVTETYTYDGAGGQISKRTTKVQRVLSENDPETIQEFEHRIDSYDDLLLPKTVSMPTCPDCVLPQDAIKSVTNDRTAGHLTDVAGFGSLTYHPNGMVASVVHETPNRATDRYAVNDGMPRPSKITFSACANLAPYALPGSFVAKTNAIECGLQLTWPVAAVCGGGGGVKYRVLRNNDDITWRQPGGAKCITGEPKFIDKTAVPGVEYTYKIIAEGPEVAGGDGTCQGGMTFEMGTIKAKKGSCDQDVSLVLNPSPLTAFVGIPATYRAELKTPSGPVEDELLIFKVNDREIGRAKTAADGSAVVRASLDILPKEYKDWIKVVYEGGVLPPRTTTGTLKLFCGFPSYFVNPLLYTILPDAATYPVVVTTSTHCLWNPSLASDPDPYFVTLDSGATRQGSGRFEFSVTQNTGPERKAKIWAGNKQVSVEQSGVGCNYRFDPELVTVPAESQVGMVSMSISTTTNCQWYVGDAPGWIQFQPPPNKPTLSATDDIGPREIWFKVTPQTLPEKRTTQLRLYSDSTRKNLVATANVNQNAPLLAVKPGQIHENLRGGSVQNGSNINLRVWVKEGTQLEYRWFINDVPIYPSCRFCDSMTLHPGDNGYPAPHQSSTFQVEVFNNSGTVPSEKVSWHNNGDVQLPDCVGGRVPPIYEGPFRPADAPMDSLSPRGGSNVSLWVTSHTNSGPLTYQWFRGISGDESSAIPPDPDLPADTIRVNPFDTSFYWAKVSDKCGSNFSRSAMVVVTQGGGGRRRACCTMDITGDGHSDIPWHNTATGQNEIWAMVGTNHGNTYALPHNNDPKALLQSVGDINADGSLDLMWRNPETGHNEVWLMDRTQRNDVRTIESRPGSQWTIGAISDFDLDDHDDIVWHNSATGANEIWFGEGTDHIGTWALPNSGATTGLYGKGDFNGDEKPDLFLHNRATGENQIWIMDDGGRVGVQSVGENGLPQMNVASMAVPPSTDPNLVPALVADMNLDGKPDIVWRNSSTGENSVWLMNGSQRTSIAPIETRSDPNWQIGGGGNGTTPGSGTEPPPGQTATSLGLVVDPVSVGTPAVATATLTSGGNPVAARQVVFLLNGAEVVRLLTGPDGTATAVIETAGRGAGTYTDAVTVRFDGDTTYTASTWSANLVITAETPVVTWNEPAPIVYGTPLSATQLNATASTPGTYAYTPPAGTIVGAGYQTLTVTFTPSDTALAPITTSTVLLVHKAPSSVSWAAPAPIAYGMPLSGLQLNATSSLAGTFTYEPGPGTILGVGTQTLRVAFEPDNPNFDVSSTTTTITVGKGTQSIHWNDPAPITALQPLGPAQLNATVLPSGDAPAGQVTYTPPAGTILTNGVHELRVNVAATAEYEAASASVDVVVLRVPSVLQWATPAPIVYGTPLSAAQLNATANVAGTFTYSHSAGTVVDAGTEQLYVTFTPADPRYEESSASVTLQVNKAQQTISWSKPAPIVYSTPLSELQLNAQVQVVGPAPAGVISYSPEPGAILAAGLGQTLTVAVDATRNYHSATASVIIDVLKATQSIAWEPPAPIVYGTPLSATQLNATVTVAGPAPAGTLSYNLPVGTVMQAGDDQVLTVTAAETANYQPATLSVTIDVLKQKPVLAWATPAPIVYRTALGAAQLNATSNVPGSFAYAPPAGTVLDAGMQPLAAHFTPSDARNYEEGDVSVTLEVEQATPVITWPSPAGIVYGTALSGTQLNATADVPGTFTYDPPAGTILNAGPGQTLSVQFKPTDTRNFTNAGASVTLDIAKAKQTLAWEPPAPIVYGTPLSATQLNAAVTVVGPAPAGTLSYNPPVGTVMQAGDDQVLTVTAAETANYQPAMLSVTIDVLKQKPVLAWATPAPIVYRTALAAAQLNATSNVPGSFVYTPPAGTVLEAGMQTLSAHFTPSDTRNYEEGDVSVTLEVEQATPVITWPSPAGIVYGTALSATQLNATADVPGTFTYDPIAGTILNANPGQTLSVQFTPADTRNFTNASASVTLDVAKARQTLAWEPPAPIVYGTPLSAAQLNARVSVVGPARAGALVYTPPAGRVLDAGQHTLTVVAQETANYEMATLTATITVNRAPLSLTVDAKSKLYGSPVPALTGTLVGVVNNDPITPAYATAGTLQSVVGTYPITGSLVDPNNRLPNYNVTITNAILTVLPAPLTIAADPKSKQYSDPIPPFTATYIGLVLGETPAVLSGTLVMETTANVLSAPGAYPITIGGLTSPNYAITYVNSTLTVLPEDARVVITSPLFLTVAASGPTPVTLSATVRDISATPDAAGDTYPGDIRKATLTFVDRATGNVLCTAVIGLAGASEQTGVATCTFSRDFGTVLPATLTIGAKVGAYYTRDAAADDVVLTVSTPTPDQINGAGKVAIASAAGTHVPDAGSEAQFQIQFQYDKNGTVKGNFTFTFMRTEGGVPHRYELTPNSVSSLAIIRSTPSAKAMIVATGTLVDTTTRQTIATVPLLITATDTGDRTADQIGLTLLKSDGGIWLATGWNGVQTVQLPISNGQIQVEVKK